ncbi:hypothetical protein ATKI12_4427 [Kitasatospora sp. Ki12]
MPGRSRGVGTSAARCFRCSAEAPKAWTASKRVGSAIGDGWPVARAASLTVCRDTPGRAGGCPGDRRPVDDDALPCPRHRLRRGFRPRRGGCGRALAPDPPAARTAVAADADVPDPCPTADRDVRRSGRAPVGAARRRAAPLNSRGHDTAEVIQPAGRRQVGR